jgi:hypothetical protein
MFHYNLSAFIRRCCTPAMATDVTDQLWEMSDLVTLIESRESLRTGWWDVDYSR